MAKKYRINKFLAECTGSSRRKVEEFITDGKVFVNDKRVEDFSTKVTHRDKVTLNGKVVKLPDYKYVLFYKPAGYITSRKDEGGRKTIYAVLPEKYHDLKPVGRLDKESTGLLLLTNNGDLINKLTHPKFHIPKKYKVQVKGAFSIDDARKFQKGIEIEKGKIAVADVEYSIPKENNTFELVMTLKQGYYRQIRRMIKAVNKEVIALKRVAMGPLNLKNLKRGETIELKEKEVKTLLDYVESQLDKAT